MQYFVASDFSADVDTEKGSIRFGCSSRNPNNDYSIIREMRVDSTFDYLDFINKGGSRTLLYTHDLVTKRIDIQKFELVKDEHKLLNDNRLLSDAAVSNSEPLILTASKYWGAIDVGDRTNTKFLQKRISQMAQYDSFKIEIFVHEKSFLKSFLIIKKPRGRGPQRTFLKIFLSADIYALQIRPHVGGKFVTQL